MRPSFEGSSAPLQESQLHVSTAGFIQTISPVLKALAVCMRLQCQLSDDDDDEYSQV